MLGNTIRAELERIAERVLRLTISRHDPERFWLGKSEVAQALRQAARALAVGRPKKDRRAEVLMSTTNSRGRRMRPSQSNPRGGSRNRLPTMTWTAAQSKKAARDLFFEKPERCFVFWKPAWRHKAEMNKCRAQLMKLHWNSIRPSRLL